MPSIPELREHVAILTHLSQEYERRAARMKQMAQNAAAELRRLEETMNDNTTTNASTGPAGTNPVAEAA
ncbi:MAG TPA: hypothetical protein VHI93_01400 [Candidatus Thermoplasmatota archaeon]|nr:hypothetical protein [Candidatus Thermoplasmatota archaeon]